MIDAHNALERFNNGYCEPSGDGDIYWFNSSVTETIRTALKHAEQLKEQLRALNHIHAASASAVDALSHENEVLKGKMDGLVKALERIHQPSIDGKCQAMIACEAISAFGKFEA